MNLKIQVYSPRHNAKAKWECFNNEKRKNVMDNPDKFEKGVVSFGKALHPHMHTGGILSPIHNSNTGQTTHIMYHINYALLIVLHQDFVSRKII